MEDNLLISLLAGIFGRQFVQYVIDNNRKVKIPFVLLYAICFTLIYSVATIFSALVHLIKEYDIAWKGIGIFSISVSFSITLCTYVLDKIKKRIGHTD